MSLFHAAFGLAKKYPDATTNLRAIELLKKQFPDTDDKQLEYALSQGRILFKSACEIADDFHDKKIDQEKAINKLASDFTEFERQTCESAFYFGLYVTK